jgi:hypothetical protein
MAIQMIGNNMGNQTDYFNRIGYQPKYFLGERVFGHWNKIPFVGSVGNDRCINGVDAEITIHLDLPIKYNGTLHTFIIVKHQDVKLLKNYD